MSPVLYCWIGIVELESYYIESRDVLTKHQILTFEGSRHGMQGAVTDHLELFKSKFSF